MRVANLSLKKGLDILGCFCFDDKSLSVQEISARLKIPLSTTYRYVETLEERGFLTRKANGKAYKLGYMVFQIGKIGFLQMRLIDSALPQMKSLASLSGETVLLMMVSGFKALCIESIESDRLIRLSLKRGASLPLHAGAPSKLLLAYQNESFIEFFLENASLIRYTPKTITDPETLRRELLQIREQGFAFSSQEVDPGDCAISAPIPDENENLIAGLALAGPLERIAGNKERMTIWVKEVALRIANDINYQDKSHNQNLLNGEFAGK
jgi:DNA-binding IclR family transcriptional regulator